MQEVAASTAADAGPDVAGVLFVNGFNLGWFWPDAGPAMTMYVPGAILHSGSNEVLVLAVMSAPDDLKGEQAPGCCFMPPCACCHRTEHGSSNSSSCSSSSLSERGAMPASHFKAAYSSLSCCAMHGPWLHICRLPSSVCAMWDSLKTCISQMDVKWYALTILVCSRVCGHAFLLWPHI